MNSRGRPKTTVDFKLSKNPKCNHIKNSKIKILKIINVFLCYGNTQEMMMLPRL